MYYEPILGMILFGILTIVMGYVSHYIVAKIDKTATPAECADWNKHHVMEISLFITGALTWLVSFGVAKYAN